MKLSLAIGILFPASLALANGQETSPSTRPAPDGPGLLSESGCVSCHAIPSEVAANLWTPAAPSLERVGARLAPKYLRELLGGRHRPDLLGHLQDDARRQAVESLVHFLASVDGPLDESEVGALPRAIDEGRALYHEVGCVACHQPQEAPWELELSYFDPIEEEDFDEGEEQSEWHLPRAQVVALEELANKTTVGELTRYLLNPLAVHPSGRMPDMKLDESEARAIAMYLLRAQALDDDAALSDFPGLIYEYFEAPFADDVADFDSLTAVRTGTVNQLEELGEHRGDHFGFRMRGAVRIDEAGSYTFSTRSDDGSRLFIDGQLVVQNDGFHAMTREEGTLQLEPGMHSIEVTMFEGGGGEGLVVEWSGPGFTEQPIESDRLLHRSLALRPPIEASFAPTPPLVEAGRELFGRLDCGACHALEGTPPVIKAGPALAELADASRDGCLGPDAAEGRPLYRFDPAQRNALRAALADLDRWARPRSAAERLEQRLEQLSCTSCHSRGALGGPRSDLRAYFLVRGHHDLGDEGRIPPTLDEAGSKLRPDALRGVLVGGETSRPYMATRMPLFRERDAAEIAELLLTVDDPSDADAEPEFSFAAVEDGRRLVGTDGLGCIQCHKFAGHESLGIPAVDLADVHRRIQYDWFARLLNDPVTLNMNTRMPEFWVKGRSPVEDVLDGDPDAQIAAMWAYLSLADAMPLPEGLVVDDEFFELVPREQPVTCSVFMRDVSPRTLVVGLPEHLHYAFDLQNSRLAKLWRGRFFNARGTWQARAGELELPPVADVIDLPKGPSLAVLDRLDAPWPDRIWPKPLGRIFDRSRRPVFRYELGGYEISEHLSPVTEADKVGFLRRIEVSAETTDGRLLLRLAKGDEIEELGGGIWQIENELELRVLPDTHSKQPAPIPYLVGRAGDIELRVLIPVRRQLSDEGGWSILGHLQVELSW